MQIIDITSKHGQTISPKIADALSQLHNVTILPVASSSVSAFSSMRITSALKKFPAEIIVTHTVKDATAAVSARKIATDGVAGFRIILFIDNHTAMPKGLARDILDNIDAWVFSDGQTLRRWSTLRGIDTARLHLIPPTTDFDVPADPRPRVPHSPLRISWVGPINNTARLEQLLRTCTSLPAGTYTLHVYGTGKARYVMPLLDRAQEMQNLSVEWHGDNYSLEKIPAETDLHFPSEPFIENTDVFMMSHALPLFSPENFNAAINDYTSLSAKALSEYNAAYSPCFHVEQIFSLLLALRP